MKETIPIKGMHCQACTVSITKELLKVEGINAAKVSLKQRQAVIDRGGQVTDNDITAAVKRAGYSVGVEKTPIISKNPRDYQLLLGGGIIILAAVIIIDHFDGGLLLSGQAYESDAVYAVIMGLAAGFSTCMALVGGLVVSASAVYKDSHPSATRWQVFQPNLFFNLGRVVGFMGLGALLGLIGSALTFNSLTTGILTILAGLLMLYVGVQLSGVFPRLRSLALPPAIAKKLGLGDTQNQKYSHRGAFILGVLSFFLPCGFTQAMQLFAVSTGSALTGAVVMGLFAVGTTPGLLAIGGLTSAVGGNKRKIFLKLVGVIVVGLALVNINSGRVLTGFTLSDFSPLLFSSSRLDVPDENVIQLTFIDPWQQLDEKEIVLRPNEAYRIEIMPESDGVGCMATVMIQGVPEYSPRLLQEGKRLSFEFETKPNAKYTFICAMGVPFDTEIRVAT